MPAPRSAILLLAMSCLPLGVAAAEPLSAQDALLLGQAEHWARQQQWEQAAAALGQLTAAGQTSPAAKQSLTAIFRRLYAPPPAAHPVSGTGAAPVPETDLTAGPRFVAQGRVTRRRLDAEENADQIFDDQAWQYNTAWLAEWDAGGWRHLVRGAVDGYQDGKHDLRDPRQLSYQARREGVRLTAGDVRNFLTLHRTVDPADATGYTLRSTQLRGLDAEITTGANTVHLMAGVAPYFRSKPDEYTYPRLISGIRDSVRFAPWYRAAIGASYVRDRDEAIARVDPAIQPRETSILSVEQDLTVIPGLWTINTENAYSVTDDDLRPERSGANTKLKDFAHSVFSEWIWPALRVLGTYERIGPDFRAPSDIAAIGAINSKNISADREHLIVRAYPRRWGPLFGDLLYSRTQNNLDNDSGIERTREQWLAAQGGLQLADPWPQVGTRATFTRTVSIPGSAESPDRRWLYDLSGELRKRWLSTDWTGESHYWQAANDETTAVDDEYRRTWRLRAGRGLWPGGAVSGWAGWTRAHDRFNNTTLRRHTEREANLTASSRLWSTASLSAGATYQDLGAPMVVDNDLQTAGGGIVRTFSGAFLWPATWRMGGGRAFTLLPALNAHYAVASDQLERHPAWGARLTARYAVRETWRLEGLLEYRRGEDRGLPDAETAEWRGWVVVTSTFGAPVADESPFR